MTFYIDPEPPTSLPTLHWGVDIPINSWVDKSGEVEIHTDREVGFLTRHGNSLVRWYSESRRTDVFVPLQGWNVRFPNGSTGYVARSPNPSGTMFNPHRGGWRRRSDNGRSFWPGHLSFNSHEPFFEDVRSLAQIPEFSKRELERQLTETLSVQYGYRFQSVKHHWLFLAVLMAEDRALIEDFQDDVFAYAFVLFCRCNELMRMKCSTAVLWQTDRNHGEIAAGMRRVGETYMDFSFELPPLASHVQNRHFDLIAERLKRLGYATTSQIEYMRPTTP